MVNRFFLCVFLAYFRQIVRYVKDFQTFPIALSSLFRYNIGCSEETRNSGKRIVLLIKVFQPFIKYISLSNGGTNMKSFTFTVKGPMGIHARPAGLLAKMAKTYPDTVITLTKGEKTVKMTQLMMLMGLAVKSGDTVSVSAEGASEDAAIAALEQFFQENL